MNVLSFEEELVECDENGHKEQTEGKAVEKINALNEIFENLISDASDLVKDLYWSVKMYLFFGLIMVLFGVQTIVYNIDSFQEQFYIPLFVAGTMLFAGSVKSQWKKVAERLKQVMLAINGFMFHVFL
jgi:Ca2+/Na+ antiporter